MVRRGTKVFVSRVFYEVSFFAVFVVFSVEEGVDTDVYFVYRGLGLMEFFCVYRICVFDVFKIEIFIYLIYVSLYANIYTWVKYLFRNI